MIIYSFWCCYFIFPSRKIDKKMQAEYIPSSCLCTRSFENIYSEFRVNNLAVYFAFRVRFSSTLGKKSGVKNMHVE